MAIQNWTAQEKLAALMRLPWTLRITEEPDGSRVARVEEIPDAIATGRTSKELAVDLWESLAGSLEIRLEHDDPIPLPKGSTLPWEAAQTRVIQRIIRQRTGESVKVELSATPA